VTGINRGLDELHKDVGSMSVSGGVRHLVERSRIEVSPLTALNQTEARLSRRTSNCARDSVTHTAPA